MHFLRKTLISFSACQNYIYEAITLTLRDAMQRMMQWCIEVPCVNGDADRIFRSMNHKLTDFFLVQAASLFTLPRFRAQIYWRVKSPCLNPISYCQSNRLLILLYGEKGHENMFLNGKRHVKKMDIDRHGPRLMPNNCQILDPPYFLLSTNFKWIVSRDENFWKPEKSEQRFLEFLQRYLLVYRALTLRIFIIWAWHITTKTLSKCHHYWFSFIFFQTEYLEYVRQVQASSFCKFSSNSSSVCRKSSKRETVLRNYIFPDKSNVFSHDLILSLFLVPMQTQKLSFEWKQQKQIAGTCHLLLILCMREMDG